MTGDLVQAARHPHSQNPSDMGSPSHITLASWVRVRIRVTGDAHITQVLGMGMPKTGEMPIPLRHRNGKREDVGHDVDFRHVEFSFKNR